MAKLARERLGLAIVGDGPQHGALAARIRELGLDERVWMPGDQRDVVPWLRSFDVFALPSYANEGVPQALLQAMLCGLPCVTTRVGAIGEAAIDGDTALVVPPQDADALARAIDRLLADPALRSRLGAAARAHCAARFGYDAMLDRMERPRRRPRRRVGRLRVLPRAAWALARSAGRRAPPAAPERILVAHHLLLGDTLMLTPLLAKRRERHPAADIAMTTPRVIAPLYRGAPYGVRALAYDTRAAGTFDAPEAARGFDLAYVPADNRFSWLAAVPRALDRRVRGDRPAYKSWPWTSRGRIAPRRRRSAT
jgi:hypothetical protein